MYNNLVHRKKAVFTRCLKPFNKQESDEEYGNCCSSLQKKALFKGFAEIAKSKRCPRIGIKLLVFFLCTSGFLYQTWSFLQIYLAYPTTLDISEEYPDSFLAPAITFCNTNRLLRQPYCKTYPEKCTWEHTSWESFCKTHRRMCPQTKPPDFNFGIPIFRNLFPQNRSNEFLDVVASTEQKNIIEEYRIMGMENSSTTVMYLKYLYNGLPYRCFSLFSLNKNYNKETFNLTLDDGYLVKLDLHPEEYFNTYDSVQASVVLHDPRKFVNPLTDGITLRAGKIYLLFSSMERRESLPQPYASNCFDYFALFNDHGGIGPLSKDDCINECKIARNLEKYGCIGQSMTYTALNHYTVCEHPSLEITSEEHRKCAAICPDACEENLYHITVDDAFDYSGSCPPTDEHCKNQFLIIFVSFNRMKMKKIKQIPRFESIELFSYIGGYLGLWLGISLASVFDLAEMTYDVMSSAFLKRARNKKRTTHIEQLQLHTAVKK